MQKVKAVVEVAVVFGLTLLLIALVGLSPAGSWERQVIKSFFCRFFFPLPFAGS
jgi:hypothetical protein